MTKCQVTSSNGLVFMVLWIFGGKESVDQLFTNKGVFRTAQAAPGLLNIYNQNIHCQRMYPTDAVIIIV